MDLSCTIIPAYFLNHFLTRLPIIGEIIFGGKNDGLFATNLQLRGPLTEPKISGNPIRTFMPGILKKFIHEEEKLSFQRKIKALEKQKSAQISKSDNAPNVSLIKREPEPSQNATSSTGKTENKLLGVGKLPKEVVSKAPCTGSQPVKRQ
jgi:hypothetical protein